MGVRERVSLFSAFGYRCGLEGIGTSMWQQVLPHSCYIVTYKRMGALGYGWVGGLKILLERAAD